MPTTETPKVLHQGLLVPNAVGLTYPRMSEPDQLDFATAANAQWGVVDDCKVTISVYTVIVNSGTALINGKLVHCLGGSVTLASSGTLDRFDCVVVNESGGIEKIEGAYTVDPVCKDVPLNMTLLAVVFCPVGAESFAGLVVDKRRFVSKALLTKIGVTDPLIYNANGDGTSIDTGYGPDTFGSACHFSVLGDGYMEWEGDTCLYRNAPGSLRIKSNLSVDFDVSAGNAVQAKTIRATQTITGSNLFHQELAPASATTPLGAVHQNSVNGDISVNTAAGWKQLALVDGIMPVGSIIQSVEPPSVMNPKGWVLLDGTTISETTWPRLFTLSAFGSNGEVGSRTLTLPNMSDRIPRGSTSLGMKPGGSNQVTLTVDQLPRHSHNVRSDPVGFASVSGRTGRAGRHSHDIAGGAHTHPVTDPGHNHNGGEYPAGAFVCLVWGGQNKIDALFNDRNHTYSVESVQWTRPNTTGITVGTTGSEHSHVASESADHDHSFTLDAFPDHNHLVTESAIGNNQPIDITPAYMTTFFYIRA